MSSNIEAQFAVISTQVGIDKNSILRIDIVSRKLVFRQHMLQDKITKNCIKSYAGL